MEIALDPLLFLFKDQKMAQSNQIYIDRHMKKKKKENPKYPKFNKTKKQQPFFRYGYAYSKCC
jgi:hypothetical protein